jgi:predicted HTH domain antitoxin
MVIEISDKLLNKSGLTSNDILLKLAIMLFQEERMTLTQASQLADLHQFQFQKILAKKGIPIHYGKTEFRRDLETIKQF